MYLFGSMVQHLLDNTGSTFVSPLLCYTSLAVYAKLLLDAKVM